MGIYGTIMLLVGLYHIKMMPKDNAKVQVATLSEGFSKLREVVVTFFQKKYIWLGILFLILYRFAEGQAIKIAPLFLKADKALGGLGLSTSEIGLAYGVFGSAAFVAGSLAGGYFVSHKGLNTKTLLILCSFFNLPFAMYALLAYFTPSSMVVITGAVMIEYFGYGFGFVGLTLFMMQQIAPGDYKMSHYAFATGIMNLGVMIPSMLSGYLSDMMGYKTFFIWVLIATIPAFLICWFIPLKPVVQDESQETK